MKNLRLRPATATLALLLASSFAWTGPALAKKDGGGHAQGDAPNDGERDAMRARIRAKLQTYLTVELTSRAGLDDKKAVQLSGAIHAQLDRMDKTRDARKANKKKLQELVDKKAADADIRTALKAFTDAHGREQDIQAFLDDTAKFLTATEQAKVALALPDVLGDVRKMIKDARREGGGGGRRNRSGGDGARGDDNGE